MHEVKSEREVAQLCPTPSDPMDCSLPGSSVHGIFQARVLEWVAIAFSYCNNQRQIIVAIVQSLNLVQLFVTPWTEACEASLSFTISKSLLKLMSTESVMPSSHLILCHPLLFLPSVFPRIRVFSNELALRIRWPKYWSFSISPSNEYSKLISFRIDWFDLLAIQGTRVFSNTTVQKHQFFSTQPSFWSSSHIRT